MNISHCRIFGGKQGGTLYIYQVRKKYDQEFANKRSHITCCWVGLLVDWQTEGWLQSRKLNSILIQERIIACFFLLFFNGRGKLTYESLIRFSVRRIQSYLSHREPYKCCGSWSNSDVPSRIHIYHILIFSCHVIQSLKIIYWIDCLLVFKSPFKFSARKRIGNVDVILSHCHRVISGIGKMKTIEIEIARMIFRLYILNCSRL